MATITPITIEELTSKVVGGTGTFDCLMASVRTHMKEEFKNGTLTGDQYTKAYIELTSMAMSTALQFLLSKDKVTLEAELLQAQVKQAGEQALSAAIERQIAQFNLDNLLPQELIIKEQQAITLDIERQINQFNLDSVLPRELALLNSKILASDADKDTTLFELTNILPEDQKIKQQQALSAIKEREVLDFNVLHMLPAQRDLVLEQIEVQHAQVSDTLKDGATTITGSIGRQKELYAQQIKSYDLDAKFKVAKMYLDGWITQKTLDDGLLAPNELTNTEINKVLAEFRVSNDYTP